MNAKRFLQLSDAELRAMFDKPIGKCAYAPCGKEVRPSQEHRTVPHGIYHEDCYFDALGNFVEAHPICSPGRRGVGVVLLDESPLVGVATA